MCLFGLCGLIARCLLFCSFVVVLTLLLLYLVLFGVVAIVVVPLGDVLF